jgi:hypothetical protein
MNNIPEEVTRETLIKEIERLTRERNGLVEQNHAYWSELKELREENDKLKADKLYWGLEARAKQEIERLKAGDRILFELVQLKHIKDVYGKPRTTNEINLCCGKKQEIKQRRKNEHRNN